MTGLPANPVSGMRHSAAPSGPDPQRLACELPTQRLIRRPVSDIEVTAHRLLPILAAALGSAASATVVPCMSQIGSGSLPVDLLPSAGLSMKPPGRRPTSAVEVLASAFRALPIPVIGRVHDGCFVLDLRCLEDEAQFSAQLQYLNVQGRR